MASFAHEMRTPMTSIIGYADLLRSTELPPASRAEAVHYIFSEGKRLESLSNKLLDLIVLQKQDIAKKPCNMGALIRQAGGLFEQRFQKAGITFSCQTMIRSGWWNPICFKRWSSICWTMRARPCRMADTLRCKPGR